MASNPISCTDWDQEDYGPGIGLGAHIRQRVSIAVSMHVNDIEALIHNFIKSLSLLTVLN